MPKLMPASDLGAGYSRNFISYSKKEIRMDCGAESIETIRGFFKGGEGGGSMAALGGLKAGRNPPYPPCATDKPY